MKKRLLTIVIAFAASFILMVVLSLFSLARFEMYTDYTNQVEQTNQVITALYRTEVNLKDLDRAERGYTVTRDTSHANFLNATIDSLRPALAALEALTKGNDRQSRNMAMLKSNIALRITYARQNMEYIDTAQSMEPSPYFFEGRKVMRDAAAIIRVMHENQKIALDERFKNQKDYQQLTSHSLRYILVIFCILTLLLFVLLTQALRGRLRFQKELQARITELDRSHGELGEIAYAASHDLQEPLRKIQVFSNMLSRQPRTEGDTRDKLERINTAAEQLQELIAALMSLTTLNKESEPKTNVDLNGVLNAVVTEMSEQIAAAHATVNIKPLPRIEGFRDQLQMLFTALLDNALKFSREGVAPVITVFYDLTDGSELADINADLANRKFHRVTCEDNGIGFDNKFSDKLFRLYQTLHNPNEGYKGKGTGLAISRRIMSNHDGYIIARGAPDQGAKFKLFFPVEGQ
jgi:signal transduction histidine kinase